MNWKLYRKKFTDLARSRGYEEDEIKTSLKYARSLYKSGVPIIYDQEHLSLLVGYSLEYLRRASNDQFGSFYRHFTIPKKSSNSVREIDEPLPSLKEIQRWVLDNILYNVPISPYSKAYSKKSSIKNNARFHIKQKYLVRLDVKDFFPSITMKDVYYIFREIGYSQGVSGVLAGLCTLDESLPQGAPTSPMLSNIFMFSIDNRVSGYCRERGIRYTRYADDMTFSGDFNYSSLISFVDMVMEEKGLSLHPEKTKIMKQSDQQRTTGLVVNSRMNTPRSLRRKLRQDVYYLKKFGLAGHLRRTRNTRANYLPHLLGMANFILSITPEDKDALEARSYLQKLMAS